MQKPISLILHKFLSVPTLTAALMVRKITRKMFQYHGSYSLEIGNECDCYSKYYTELYNETVTYERFPGATVLERLAFSENNILRYAVKI